MRLVFDPRALLQVTTVRPRVIGVLHGGAVAVVATAQSRLWFRVCVGGGGGGEKFR
jgi:hypothetical protein